MRYKRNKKINITLFVIFTILTITCITILMSNSQISQIALSKAEVIKANSVARILLTGKVNLDAANGKGRSGFRLVNL